MPEIHEPLLVIHGGDDSIISAKHGKRPYDASPAEVKSWHPVPNAGHNDLFIVERELPDVILEFADEISADSFR